MARRVLLLQRCLICIYALKGSISKLALISRLTSKIAKLADAQGYVPVDAIAYDEINKRLGLKVNGADTVIPFRGGGDWNNAIFKTGINTRFQPENDLKVGILIVVAGSQYPNNPTTPVVTVTSGTATFLGWSGTNWVGASSGGLCGYATFTFLLQDVPANGITYSYQPPSGSLTYIPA